MDQNSLIKEYFTKMAQIMIIIQKKVEYLQSKPNYQRSELFCNKKELDMLRTFYYHITSNIIMMTFKQKSIIFSQLL